MGALSNKKISTAYARQLVKNYKDRKRVGEDTQAVWFSTTEILAALGLGNLEVPINHPVSGVRFYFGSYGFENEHKLEFDTYNKNTLLMVQTGNIQMGNPVQGNPIYQDVFDNVQDVASYPLENNASLETNEESETEIMIGKIFNDGQVIPPPSINSENDLICPSKLI